MKQNAQLPSLNAAFAGNCTKKESCKLSIKVNHMRCIFFFYTVKVYTTLSTNDTPTNVFIGVCPKIYGTWH